MGSYYFLGAQLPFLIYGQNPPMTSADFKALAWDLMESRDAVLLDYCTLDPDPEEDPSQRSDSRIPSEFIKRWREWERSLRLNLARGRSVKLKRDGTVDAPEFPSDAVLAAKNALTMDSPLEAELLIDKARWDAIESFQGIDSFNENAMYAYLLKLLLMERRAAFDIEEGNAEYKALYTAILGEAK